MQISLKEKSSKMVRPLSESKERIIEDLLDQVATLDAEFEKKSNSGVPLVPLAGLHVFPGIVLLLKHYALSIQRYKVEEFVSKYDHFILVFPDFLSIRAVRFSGEKKKLDIDSSFWIEKLSRKKGERSKIGEELLGSFITQGKIENVTNLFTFLQILSPLLLALIRPLSKDNLFIIPSPLSFITHEIAEFHSPRKVFLSPCTMTVILKSAKYREIPVLGKRLKGIFSDNATALAFDASNENIKEINLNVFLPLEEFSDQNFSCYRDHLKAGKRVITHLLGILILEEMPILEGAHGYFMALQELDAHFDIQALAICGNVCDFKLKFPSKCYYYSIKCEKQKVEKFKELVLGKILSIKRKLGSVYSTLENPKIGGVLLKEFSSKCFLGRDHHIKLLAPSLLPMLITNTDMYENIERLLERLREITSMSEEINAFSEFRKLLEDKIYGKILAKLDSGWNKSLSNQQSFVKKWNLSYII